MLNELIAKSSTGGGSGVGLAFFGFGFGFGCGVLVGVGLAVSVIGAGAISSGTVRGADDGDGVVEAGGAAFTSEAWCGSASTTYPMPTATSVTKHAAAISASTPGVHLTEARYRAQGAVRTGLRQL
jgi:hypothetical protein